VGATFIGQMQAVFGPITPLFRAGRKPVDFAYEQSID
jgi:hypothetical protein